MIDRLVALIVDESKWLTASIGLALLALTVLIFRHRHSDLPAKRVVSMAVVVSGGLFIGSLIFLPSGQNFEQFSGIE